GPRPPLPSAPEGDSHLAAPPAGMAGIGAAIGRDQGRGGALGGAFRRGRWAPAGRPPAGGPRPRAGPGWARRRPTRPPPARAPPSPRRAQAAGGVGRWGPTSRTRTGRGPWQRTQTPGRRGMAGGWEG